MVIRQWRKEVLHSIGQRKFNRMLVSDDVELAEVLQVCTVWTRCNGLTA